MVDDTPERQDPCADESCVLEAQARLAVEAAGLSTWIWDVAADRFTISRRFAEILGRPGLEATAFNASTIAEMTHPDDRDMVASELSKVLERTEHVFDTEHRGVTPDGRVVWLRARAAVVERDRDGAPASVAGVVEDRTDAKAGELAREAEARRTGLVLEASGAGVWDWDVESGEIYWSPRLREMLGVSPDTQIRIDELQRYAHPEDQPRLDAELRAHLEHGAPYAFDMRMIKRSGETIAVRVHGKAELNADGAPVRMAGSIVDITRARETELAVLEADARASLALDSAGLVLLEHDLETNLVQVSPSLGHLLGRAELVGRTVDVMELWRHIHPDDYGHITDRFRQLLNGSISTAREEARVVRADGSERWASINTARPRTPLGEPSSRMISVITDLTERKTAELQLAEEKRRYDLAVAGAMMAIWEWDQASGMVTWSARFNEILGLPADHPGEHFDAFNARVHPDDRASMDAESIASAEEGRPYEHEFRMRCADGTSWVMVRSRASARTVDENGAVRIAGTVTDVTALHAAREEAARASQRVALSVKAAGLGTFDFGLEKRVMIGSARTAEIIGEPDRANEELPLQHMLDIIHPADRKAAFKRLAAAESAGESFTSEHRIIQPDGAVVWTLTLAAPARLKPDGSVAVYTGVIQDLTERKQVELDLADAKHRFERAAEGSFIAVCDWELETGDLRWSRQFNELLGLGADERITSVSQMASFIHPGDIERLRVAQHRHLEHGETYDLEHRMIRKDGAVIRVQARGVADRDEHGVAVRFIGSLMDVTAEREAQEAARYAGARAQYALEAANLCVWEFDVSAQMVTMDQPLADLLGRPELANKPLTDDQVFAFTAPEDLEDVQALLARVTRGEQPVVRSEHRVIHKDGRRIWILAHVGAAEHDERGRPKRIIGITQDLSRQKAVEQDLRDAKERAEAANEAKSAFLATMSHEIRTPLNGVLGMAQLLALGELDDKQRGYAETILSSGRSLSAIIDDVLDISRIEAGKMNLSPVRADIRDIVHAALEPSQAVAADKGLTLSIDLDAAVGEARFVDATRMSQVLANLISNAVKFTEAGSVRVRARAPAPGRVRFEVEDDGPGVPHAMQARIFERFTQADMSTQRAHGGAGLGLAIAKELTELAGGEIGVISHDGQGALFWFEIPAPIAPGQAGEDEAGARGQSVEGARVLVVEDHAVNRTTTVALLESVGLIARQADSAAAGLHVLRTEPVDAVLLDMHMPGDGGDVVLKAIREGSAGRTTLPVFFVTADVTVEARQSAQALGADGFFSKPLEFHAIHAALNDALSGRKTGA